MKTSTKILVALSTAALLASGCNPQISGEEGNLALTFDEGASGGATGSSPLAVGGTLAYSAHLEGEKDQKVSFTSATSSDDSVILVDGVSGGLMRLEGIGEGEATIDVDADGPDGASVSDSFGLSTATVDAVEFAHPCAPEDDAVYLVEHAINLHYKMRSAGSLAVGYGHYPVALDPANRAELADTTTNGLLPLRSSSEAGSVTVSSEVNDEEIELTLIQQGDIDGVRIFEEEFDLPTSVDNTLDIHLLPTVEGLLSAVEGSVPVCQSDIEMTLTNDTPETCELAYGPAEREQSSLFNLYEPNALAITGKAEGSCEFTVTIPAADDGQGVDASFSVDVLGSGDDE